MTQPLRVLLIEDSALYRSVIENGLREASKGLVELTSVDRLAPGLERLAAGGVDAVLLDLILPDSSGIETLWRTLASSADTPVIVLTALDDEDLALRAVKAGAQDFLGKERMTGDAVLRSIRHGIERKRLHVRLEQNAKELERVARDLVQFTDVASERLDSPLQIVREALQRVERSRSDHLDDEDRGRIESALEAVDAMRRLFEDFTLYVHIGLARDEVQSSCDSGSTLGRVVADLKHAIDHSGLTITHDPLPRVQVEEGDLIPLFRHLVEHAIHMRRDDEPRLHFRAERKSDVWLFTAADNGYPLDPDYPGQVFDPFHGPSGIGLAMCRCVVERYRGRIWVESREGEGTEFHFTLPAPKVE